MSEITFETGHLPVCVDCQVKHAVDLKAHVEKGTPRYEEVAGLVEGIRKDLNMNPQQMSEYEKVRKVEHKLEDYQAVLREARHGLQEQTEPSMGSNPIPETDYVEHGLYAERRRAEFDANILRLKGYETKIEPKNDAFRLLKRKISNPEKCSFEKEVKLEKGHFDPGSFRTLCPQCPQSRCALCPPELSCATRIITGCRKGEFVEGRCRVGTETHVIYHGKA